MRTIKFETGKKLQFKNASGSSDFEGSLIPTLNRIANRYSDKEMVVRELREVTPSEFKLGYGGSHIWCANQKNERLFIIEGY